MSAVVTVDSSHMIVSSCALWSSFSPASNVVSGQMLLEERRQLCGSWSVTGHNHRKVIGQDAICGDLHCMSYSLPVLHCLAGGLQY